MVFSFSQARAATRSHARASSRVLHAVATAATSSSFLLAAAAMAVAAVAVVTCCPLTTERLELLPGMVGKMVVVVGGEH
jgi:intracellular septation protein A